MPTVFSRDPSEASPLRIARRCERKRRKESVEGRGRRWPRRKTSCVSKGEGCGGMENLCFVRGMRNREAYVSQSYR